MSSREKVRALYNYVAFTASHLSFNEGDIIEVIEKGSDGWWKGKNKTNSFVGLFPSNYVVSLLM